MIHRLLVAWLALACLPSLVLADEAAERVAGLFPGVGVANVRPAPLPGFFEVRVGTQIFYVTEDARFLIQGELYDVETTENLTASRRASVRLDAIEEMGEPTMVVFAPDSWSHTITVFTDIDCGYCRRLQREIADYMALGIRVRYLFFPRSGPGTESWTKAEQVWCSPDRLDAMTRSKAGQRLTASACNPNPVEAHFELGRDLGIRGTPALITDSGELIPGYLPAAELLRRLEANGG
ncbi:MAG: DsbC family protein [Chromatiales bacterium]|nr:DsbC family protein [Chromatiales bacterium]